MSLSDAPREETGREAAPAADAQPAPDPRAEVLGAVDNDRVREWLTKLLEFDEDVDEREAMEEKDVTEK
jgi:hypothetical protein